MRRKLHVQIFGVLCLVGAACAAIALLVGHLFSLHSPAAPHFIRDLGAFIVADLPPRTVDPAQKELQKRARRLGASISLWNAQGELVARAGRALAPPDKSLFAGEVIATRGQTAWLALDDGRVLGFAYDNHRAGSPARRLAVVAGLLLLVMVLGSYLAAVRITRRLARLEAGVDAFGEGSLDVRVSVTGRDEVARLAGAFNRAFERISRLLTQQRRMLQSASHELRSPLARVRMAVELLADNDVDAATRANLQGQAERDIEELDALISDLLLAERLTDSELPREFSDVDLAAIAREECARVGAAYGSGEVRYHGQARMLRSLLRNLLENARRYGKSPISLRIARAAGGLTICVDDAGEGVPAAEHERIFEPFYRRAGHHEGRDGNVGLGLSLVRSVAEHHGGSVRYVALEPGSRFEVRLRDHAA